MLREEEVVGRKMYVTLSGMGATQANQRLWVPPSNDPDALWQVKRAASRWGTASTSALLQVEVAGSGVAAGSGTNQLDTALDTSKTADTNVESEVSNPTVFDKNSGVNLIISGTKTNLADCVITVEIVKVK